MAAEYEVKVPDDLEAGVYANAANVWHTRSEFTLDFIVHPLAEDALDLGRLVSRVKIPTLFVFELIRRLNDRMTSYEQEYGEIPSGNQGDAR